jgi:hypothetical protein
MVLFESSVTAAPAALTLTPPVASIVMFPGVPLAAFEVATGDVTMVLIVKSSANAGLAMLASKRQASGLRFTVLLTGI